jgi:hypothetical protein
MVPDLHQLHITTVVLVVVDIVLTLMAKSRDAKGNEWNEVNDTSKG